MVATGLPSNFCMPLPGYQALPQQPWQYYLPDGAEYTAGEDELLGDGYDYAPAEFARIGQDLAQLIDKLQKQFAVDRQRLHAIHRANQTGRVVASPKQQPVETHGEPQSSWTALSEWPQQIPSLYNRIPGSPGRKHPGKHATANILVGGHRHGQEQIPGDINKEQNSKTTKRSARQPPKGLYSDGRVEAVNRYESVTLREKDDGEKCVTKSAGNILHADFTCNDTKEHLDLASSFERQQIDGKPKVPVAGSSYQSAANVDGQLRCATVGSHMACGNSEESSLMHDKIDRRSWADVKDDETDLADALTEAVLAAA